MELLNNKNVLLIVPRYFGYEELIRVQLLKAGTNVFTIIENVDNISYKYRFIKNYLPKKFPQKVDKLFMKQINDITEKIDIVFVIRGEFISENIMTYIKKRYGNTCKFVMYQWDSIVNNENALRISGYFDSISTFDLEDAKNMGWKYRPLFYIDDYLSKCKKKDIDILFIGSVHSNRIEVMNYLKKYCKARNLKLSSHLYSKRLIYFKRKYLNRRKEYCKANDLDIKFKSITLKECYKKYNRSKIVVDFTHPGQTGYTMRTIECLGCDCKLITNNQLVKKSNFYDQENIIIYEGVNLIIPDEFIETPYKIIDERIKNQYSICSWLLDIMNPLAPDC